MKENLQLKKTACRTPKGKCLLKKSGGILCEGNRLDAYRFIQKYNKGFGLRWLLRKFNICPNAYYNYLKNRKADYHQHKDEINQKWYTDFTYLFLTDGSKRYNCTIIDLP